MAINRYDHILRDYNQQIIDLLPANHVLRLELALEVRRIFKQNPSAKLLEIGVGEGDLTKQVLANNPQLYVDALDISAEMISAAKNRLADFARQIHYICDDIEQHLRESGHVYDGIASAWTLHNFTWAAKTNILELSYRSLVDGGRFLLMDKVYPDDEQLAHQLLVRQKNRHLDYLPPKVAAAINEHEDQDYLPDYRQDESQLINALRAAGFSAVEIVDRVERDIILLATR